MKGHNAAFSNFGPAGRLDVRKEFKLIQGAVMYLRMLLHEQKDHS